METNKKIEELRTQIKNLKELLKQPASKLNPIKETIENEINFYKKELQTLECNVKFKDTVGKYYKINDGHGVSYMYVREIVGIQILCDLITTLGTYEKDIHIYKNTIRFIEWINIISEISKEEFFKFYKETCDNMINNAGFGKETENTMDAIEKYLEDNGYRFYDDEAFDYYYKDSILVYKEDEKNWGARIERGFALEDYCVSEIKSVEELKEEIDFLKTKVDWKKKEELNEFIKKQKKI